MDLVVDQVMELHDVHDADGHFTIERLAGSAIVERYLPRGRQSGFLEQVKNFFFRRAVEYRRCDPNAITILLGKFENFSLFSTVDQFIGFFGTEIILQPPPERVAVLAVRAQQVIDLLPETARRPTEMRFENLAHIHARRNAEWI